MNYKKMAYGLGLLSIATGVTELFASRRVARSLDAVGHEGLIKGFGAREMVAGLGLVTAPAVSTTMWSRVAGDAMDLAALGAAASRTPGNRNVWRAIAFAAGVTLVDVIVARGLDRETGKMLPI